MQSVNCTYIAYTCLSELHFPKTKTTKILFLNMSKNEYWLMCVCNWDYVCKLRCSLITFWTCPFFCHIFIVYLLVWSQFAKSLQDCFALLHLVLFKKHLVSFSLQLYTHCSSIWSVSWMMPYAHPLPCFQHQVYLNQWTNQCACTYADCIRRYKKREHRVQCIG